MKTSNASWLTELDCGEYNMYISGYAECWQPDAKPVQFPVRQQEYP